MTSKVIFRGIVAHGWLFEREENGWVRVKIGRDSFYFGPKEWQRIQKALGTGPEAQTVLAPT